MEEKFITDNVSPPNKFLFKPEEWPGEKTRYKQYLVAAGLNSQKNNVKINSLIYTMGEEADSLRRF